jgi:capsular polysaccharide biosynthesis protein
LAVVSTVLGAVIAVSVALFGVSPSYSATVKLYVSGTGTAGDNRWQSGEYARTHVASYAEMATSDEVLNAVRDNLGLPRSRDGSDRDLAENISAENPLDTLIIDVTVEASSPRGAQAVAAAIGEVYNAVVARLESPSNEKQSPVRILVVSPPALPTAQVSPSRKLYAAVGMLAGLAVGTGVGWLLERPTRRRRGSSVSEQPTGDSWSWGHDGPPSIASTRTREASEVLVGSNRGNGNGTGRARTRQSGPADS